MIGMVFMGVSAFVFAAIIAGLLLHRIIGWWMEGAISDTQCLIMVLAYVFLLTGIITTQSTTLRIMFILLLIGLGALVPVLGENLGGKIDTKRLDDEKMQKYMQAIASDPNNMAARTKLADLLYSQGRLDEAIEIMAHIVSVRPNNSEQEAYKLRHWTLERDEKKAPPKRCPSCGQSNSPDRTRCAHCESELSTNREIVKWLKKGGLRQIVITTSITFGIIAVVMFTLTMLTPVFRIFIIALVLLIVISAEYLYMQRNW